MAGIIKRIQHYTLGPRREETIAKFVCVGRMFEGVEIADLVEAVREMLRRVIVLGGLLGLRFRLLVFVDIVEVLEGR